MSSVGGRRGLRHARGLACVLGSAAWLVICTAGRAGAAELRWSAPRECGDPGTVVEQVELLLSRPLGSVAEPDFDVQIVVAAADHWQLYLRTSTHDSGPPRVREFLGATCEEVKAAVAVAIAMTISAGEQPEAAPTPNPHAIRESDPVSAPPAAQTPAGELGPSLSIAAGLTLEYGWLPALAPGAELWLSIQLSALRLAAFGALFLPQRELLANTQRGGDFGMAVGGLMLCGELGQDRLHALGCAGFEVGQIWVDAVGVLSSDNPSRLMYGPRTELGLRWQPTDRVGFLLMVGGAVLGPRHEFILDQPEVLHRPGVVSLRALMAAEFFL